MKIFFNTFMCLEELSPDFFHISPEYSIYLHPACFQV